jgi:hypothetical protein
MMRAALRDGLMPEGEDVCLSSEQMSYFGCLRELSRRVVRSVELETVRQIMR